MVSGKMCCLNGKMWWLSVEDLVAQVWQNVVAQWQDVGLGGKMWCLNLKMWLLRGKMWCLAQWWSASLKFQSKGCAGHA
jgi:hypothetical protein